MKLYALPLIFLLSLSLIPPSLGLQVSQKISSHGGIIYSAGEYVYGVNLPADQLRLYYPELWADFWREETWKALRGWGVNYVYWRWRGGHTYPSTYVPDYAEMDQAMEWGRRNGIRTNLYYVENDLETGGGLPKEPLNVDAWIAMWTEIAEYYKGNPWVDFGVFCEPHGIELTRWHEIHQRVFDAIHTVDPDRYVYVGCLSLWESVGYPWGSAKSILEKPLIDPDKRVVYEPHIYPLLPVVQRYGNTVEGIRSCLSDFGWLTALEQGFNLHVGEVGARLGYDWGITWFSNFFKVCNELGIGYCGYNFQSLKGASAPYALLEDYVDYNPTRSGTILMESIPPILENFNFGYETKGGSSSTSRNRIYSTKFTCTSSGKAHSATVYLYKPSGTTNVKYAIYEDDNGSPGNRLAVTASTDISAGYDDWKTIDLTTNPDVTANTPYWLCVCSSASITIYWDDGETDQSAWKDETYNGFPDPFGTPDGKPDREYSIYCTVQP